MNSHLTLEDITLQDWCYDFISRLEYDQEIEDLQTFIALIIVCGLVKQKISQNKFVDQLNEDLRILHTKLIPSILEEKLHEQQQHIEEQEQFIQSFKDEQDKQRAEKEELENIIKELNDQIFLLDEKLSEYQKGFDHFEEQFQEEFELQQQLEDKIHGLENQLADSQKQIQVYKKGITNLIGKEKEVTDEEFLNMKLFGDVFKPDPYYDTNKKMHNLLSNTGYIYSLLQTAYEKIDILEKNTDSDSEENEDKEDKKDKIEKEDKEEKQEKEQEQD
ncbi:hypothetical protein pb186bvf_017867 [Paramecium bursaria]